MIARTTQFSKKCLSNRSARARLAKRLLFFFAIVIVHQIGIPPTVAADESVSTNYSHVEPIFTQQCVYCHSGPTPPEGYGMSTYEDTVSPGDWLRVVPGSPDASELVRRIRGQARPAMPKNTEPLENEDILRIERWVTQGGRDASESPMALPAAARVRLHGTLTGSWYLDGLELRISKTTRIEDSPKPGDYVQVRGRIDDEGNVMAERIRIR